MQRVLKSVVAATVVAGTSLPAATVDTVFTEGKTQGNVRLGYIAQENPGSDADTYATAVGGRLGFETAAWNGLKFGVTAYVSQEIGALSGEGGELNPDFFADGQDSFAYMGEAYFEYTWRDVMVRVGRQRIDTPLADTDDIRMLPNSFEALIATYGGIADTALVAGYVTRWAGYDSGGDISAFKRLADDGSGALVIGAMNESVEGLTLQGWYYGIDGVADALYADALYALELAEGVGFETVLQGGCFYEKEASGVDGCVAGVAGALEWGAVMVAAAFNVAMNDGGTAVVNGFGGGPYVTSMEEMTIDGLEDAKGYVVAAEADLSELGLDGAGITVAYGLFKSYTTPSDRADEVDVIGTYAASERLEAEISYATIDDKYGSLGGDWSRWLLRFNYTF